MNPRMPTQQGPKPCPFRPERLSWSHRFPSSGTPAYKRKLFEGHSAISRAWFPSSRRQTNSEVVYFKFVKARRGPKGSSGEVPPQFEFKYP